MLRRRENKLLATIGSICIIIIVIMGNVFSVNKYMLVLTALLFAALCMASIFFIEGIYARASKLSDELKGSNELLEGELDEDELGQLVVKINQLIKKLQAEEEKGKRDKEYLKEVIADISHQLKTPIATLTVFNDILLNNIEQKDFRDMLLQSEQQLERIKWLVQAMLQLARLEAGVICFDKREVQAETLISSTTDMLRQKAKEKGISFILTGDMELNAEVDAEWFQEALINILKNAIDYSPVDADIEINVSATPIATKFSIIDKGIGIPEHERLDIFKRFYRGANHSPSTANVGVGLALSKSIVESMGGKLWVESRFRDDCAKGEQSYTKMIILI
ncbi:MAG: sensor histidine kinase [Wujia sp.]